MAFAAARMIRDRDHDKNRKTSNDMLPVPQRGKGVRSQESSKEMDKRKKTYL